MFPCFSGWQHPVALGINFSLAVEDKRVRITLGALNFYPRLLQTEEFLELHRRGFQVKQNLNSWCQKASER